MRAVLPLLFIVVFSLGTSQSAFACDCISEPRKLTEAEHKSAITKEFDGSASVFSGEVVALDTFTVKFRLITMWKGEAFEEFTISTGAKKISEGSYRTSSCDYSFKAGEKYLVYARASDDHQLVARSCTRTKLLSGGQADLPELDILNPGAYRAPPLLPVSPDQDSKRQTHVLDSVPGPRDEAIRKIRTPKDWHNPYVMIYRDSFELILHDRPRTSERIQLAKLEKSLLDLPLERWPLGRVVAVQEIAIRSGRDDEKIARNMAALKRMLQAYRIRVDLWPTA